MTNPQQTYRDQLFDAVMGSRPQSILDVGCGQGDFLSRVAERECIGVGLDPDENRAAELIARGIDARIGYAESLPFPNESFDCIVMEYVPHHLANLPQALCEAVRVARRGIFILDTWCDTALPSQRAAFALDGWFKLIDRRTGMIHNDCLAVSEFLAPLAGVNGLAFDYACRLVIAPQPLAEVVEEARQYLAKIGNDPALTGELDRILDGARRDGLTYPGALLMFIRKG